MMKKYIISLVIIGILIGCFFAFMPSQKIIVKEYQKQTAYTSNKENVLEKNVFYIHTPKIYFKALNYPSQWWQGETPASFTKYKGNIIVHDKNPCKSAIDSVIIQRFVSYFFNDPYKPRKIFRENEKNSVSKGSLFDVSIWTYDTKEQKNIKYAHIKCGKIVFDNQESMDIDLQPLRKTAATIDYGFSDLNDKNLIQERMKNAKKYYVEIVLEQEIDSVNKFFKARWFFGEW